MNHETEINGVTGASRPKYQIPYFINSNCGYFARIEIVLAKCVLHKKMRTIHTFSACRQNKQTNTQTVGDNENSTVSTNKYIALASHCVLLEYA